MRYDFVHSEHYTLPFEENRGHVVYRESERGHLVADRGIRLRLMPVKELSPELHKSRTVEQQRYTFVEYYLKQSLAERNVKENHIVNYYLGLSERDLAAQF
jgi:hypothetical protein